MTAPLLSVRDLTVEYPTRFGVFTAVQDINLIINRGEVHGLVGESGAGKSTIGSAIMGLLPAPGRIAAGSVALDGSELVGLPDAAYHRLRGARISMIFQDPQTSLNPLLTVADQLVETIRQHSDVSEREALVTAIKLLEETGISDAANRVYDYPHQFSGGMRQRVVISLALCTNPDLIIADEPTTALDVAVQKQILQLIKDLAQNRGVGFIVITHDIGVIAEICSEVTVLRNGKVMESGQTAQVLGQPKDEYTKALMAAVPRLDKRLDRFTNIVSAEDAASDEPAWSVPGASAEFAADWLLSGRQFSAQEQPVLDLKNLEVTFSSKRPFGLGSDTVVKALSDISLKMQAGSVLGVIGESGSGKSTLAKAIVGLVTPSMGEIDFLGAPLPLGRRRPRRHEARRQIQMIFQDPYSSLNNRRRVGDIIAEPIRFFELATNREEQRKIVASILELVEMPQRAMLKYPHQFSGGQRQRIAIARALVAQPQFLICDEPTSALDVSIQAQILNLLKDLQERLGLTILFISHNLSVVRQMADQVAVLKGGELVEYGDAEQFFNEPSAPYSQRLMRETPSLALIAN